jgi:hypothetical protein
LSTQPVVELQDAQGNPIAQSGVPVTASIASGGGTLAGGTTEVTGGDGRAPFGDLTIVGPPGPRTLRFAGPAPLSDVVSGPVTLPSVARIAVLSSPPESVAVGTVLSNPALWSLTDAAGQPVPDVAVTLSASTGNTIDPTSATSDPNGSVQLQSWAVSQVTGKQAVTLAFPGGSSQIQIQAIHGPADSLQKISGDNQSAPVNSQLPEQLVVKAVDRFGNGVRAVLVQWRTCDGVGSYDEVTLPGGFASALQETGPEPGTFCVMASSDGLKGSPVQFTYTVTAAAVSTSVSGARVPSGTAAASPGNLPAAPPPTKPRR